METTARDYGPLLFLIPIFLVLPGCPTDRGADNDPQCTICIENAPYFEACSSVMVAAGGQPICENEGEYILCVRPQDCGPPGKK